MVKKSYVMPVSNETRTRLRTTLLAGSTGNTGLGADPTGQATTGGIASGGKDPINNGSGGIGDARRRSVSSVD